MTDDLKKYLLEQCRDWMMPEELAALRRIVLTEHGVEVTSKAAVTDPEIEKIYGFSDKKTNELIELGMEKMQLKIAERLLKEYGNEIINNCPKCGQLARTPKAKQCQHCGHDWHIKK